MKISLFKYMPLKAFFQNFLIRATGRLGLNDPFEASPSVEYFSDLCIQTEYFRFGNTKQEIEKFLNQKLEGSTWKHMGMSQFFDNGIISLTETQDNLLMWAHYADEHKGIVVELDYEHDFFTNKFSTDENPYLGKISRVLYRKERLRKFNNFVEPYFHKSDEWIYEKEHRFLVSLHMADRKLIWKDDLKRLINDKKLSGVDASRFSSDLREIKACDFHGSLVMYPEVMFMYNLPPESIKSVIIGAKMPSDDKDNLLRLIADNPKLEKVEVFAAELDPYRYQINIKKT